MAIIASIWQLTLIANLHPAQKNLGIHEYQRNFDIDIFASISVKMPSIFDICFKVDATTHP